MYKYKLQTIDLMTADLLRITQQGIDEKRVSVSHSIMFGLMAQLISAVLAVAERIEKND